MLCIFEYSELKILFTHKHSEGVFLNGMPWTTAHALNGFRSVARKNILSNVSWWC